MTVQEIQGKIETLEQRREELQATAENARQELAEAREDVIEGVDGAEERATHEQARLTSTEGTIRTVEDRLESFRAELEEERRRIDHDKKIDQLAELAQQGVDAMEMYNTTRQELARQFEAAADVLQEASSDAQNAIRAFKKLRRSLADELPDSEIMKRLDGADLSVVTADNLNPEPLPGKYAQAIGKAIQDAALITERERMNGRVPEPARA